MKIGVYDEYWSTGGGGERFAAGIAAALAPEHEVDLLTPYPVDLDWLGERLQLDLGGVRVEAVSGDDQAAGSRASEGYDLFVNASYGSVAPNRARHGLYVVHFPGAVQPRLQRTVDGLLATPRRWLHGPDQVEVGLADGFHTPAPARTYTLHWTTGDAQLVLRAAPEGGPGRAPRRGRIPVTLFFGRYVPRPPGPVEVTAEIDGAPVGRATVAPPRSKADRRRAVALGFEVDAADLPLVVRLRSPGWVPAEHGVGPDERRLGVPLLGAHLGGRAVRLARMVPLLGASRPEPGFLDTYDRVLANSRYTQEWITRIWRRGSGVLYPPVAEVPRAGKEPVILSVGRFFTPGVGHSKKQLEMVRAFRRLRATGRAEGWVYHLVGGCAPEHRTYLDQVVREAEGLPVVVHADASGSALRDLYGRASIFWHATGLGEDAERHPERLEHFGITTVEAMSAGAVPVVYDGAGQVEIVEQGVSGYRFRTEDGLVAETRRLIDAPGWLATMSAAAERRAADFGWEAFTDRVQAAVREVVAGD